jgi:hypothetical protein
MSTYVYDPLDGPGEQARRLEVLPARDNDSVTMTCISSHNIPPSNASTRAKLRPCLNLPIHFAISYVCGSGTDLKRTHYIIVDGQLSAA